MESPPPEWLYKACPALSVSWQQQLSVCLAAAWLFSLWHRSLGQVFCWNYRWNGSPQELCCCQIQIRGVKEHIFRCLKKLIFSSLFKYRFLLWSGSCCSIVSRQKAMTEFQLKFIFLHLVFPLNNPEIITLCMHILQFVWVIQNGIINIQGHILHSLQ